MERRRRGGWSSRGYENSLEEGAKVGHFFFRRRRINNSTS
jgi:hypothetical protein